MQLCSVIEGSVQVSKKLTNQSPVVGFIQLHGQTAGEASDAGQPPSSRQALPSVVPKRSKGSSKL